MKNCYFLTFLFIFVFLFFSCKKKDITPAFLYLSEKDFEDCIENNCSKFNNIHNTSYTDAEFQIIRQQNFKDVYVSLNGKALGYWQFPCTIPLLPDYSGENNIRIIPCVRIPNTTITTTQYHFVNPVDRSFTIEKKGELTFHDIILEYNKEVSFSFLETFSQSTNFASIDTVNHCASLIILEEESLGEIILNDSLPFFNVVTGYKGLLGQNCRHFWEISYKSSGEMITYLEFRGSPSGATHQDMIVHPSTNGVWKKVYIDISDIIKLASNGASRLDVRLGMRGLRNADVPTAFFYFEYVKLISMYAPY
jgi:hypothetical protein